MVCGGNESEVEDGGVLARKLSSEICWLGVGGLRLRPTQFRGRQGKGYLVLKRASRMIRQDDAGVRCLSSALEWVIPADIEQHRTLSRAHLKIRRQ